MSTITTSRPSLTARVDMLAGRQVEPQLPLDYDAPGGVISDAAHAIELTLRLYGATMTPVHRQMLRRQVNNLDDALKA